MMPYLYGDNQLPYKKPKTTDLSTYLRSYPSVYNLVDVETKEEKTVMITYFDNDCQKNPYNKNQPNTEFFYSTNYPCNIAVVAIDLSGNNYSDQINEYVRNGSLP